MEASRPVKVQIEETAKSIKLVRLLSNGIGLACLAIAWKATPIEDYNVRRACFFVFIACALVDGGARVWRWWQHG